MIVCHNKKQKVNPFYFEKIEDQLTNDPRKYKLKVSINGSDLEVKTTSEVYKYIRAEYRDIMMPDKNQFLAEHRKILANDFVMIGFHGTNEIAALSIMLNKEFKPSSNFEKNTHWIGVYAAENLKLALEGYANDIEDTSMKKHSRVLAVYAKREDVKNIGITLDDLEKTFGNEADGLVEEGPGFGLNDKKFKQSILAGEDSGFKLNEMVIKMGIDLKATVLPIITENDFNSVLKYFSLQDVADKVLQNIESLPFLEDLKSIRDLSQEDSKKLDDIINTDGASELKNTLNLLDDIYLGQHGIEDILKIKYNVQELKNLRDNNGDYDDDEQEVIRKIFEKGDLNQWIQELESFKESLGQDDFSLKNKKQIEKTLFQLKDLSIGDEKNVEAVLKNQDFKDLSQENKKAIEAVLKINDVHKFDTSLQKLNQLNLSTSLKNILGSLDTSIINYIFTVLQNNKCTLDNGRILEDIFTIQDDFKVDNILEIIILLNLEKPSAIDLYDLEKYLSRQNNPVIAVKHFKILSDFFNFKALADNDLQIAKEMLNFNKLSNEGFLSLRDYFLDRQNSNRLLDENLNFYKALKDLLTYNNYSDESPVKSMEELLSSEELDSELIKMSVEFAVNFHMKSLKKKEPDELTHIIKFYNKEHFVTDNIDEMREVFYPDRNDENSKNFDENDFKAIINYFSDSKNNIFNAIEDFQPLKDVLEFKHLSDNDLDSGKKLLKQNDLTFEDFKTIKHYFASHNLNHSVKGFKALTECYKDVKELMRIFQNCPESPEIKHVKKLLNLKTLPHNSIRRFRHYFASPNLIRSAKNFKRFKNLLLAHDLQPLQFKNVLLLEEHNLKEVKYLIEPTPIPLKYSLCHALGDFNAEKQFFLRSKRL